MLLIKLIACVINIPLCLYIIYPVYSRASLHYFFQFYTIMYTVVRRGLAMVFCSSQSTHLHPGVRPDESRFTPGDSEHQAEHLIVLTKCS